MQAASRSIKFETGDSVLEGAAAELANLYGVPTKVLVQSVKRNRGRFPPDFMFQLTDQEVAILKSQTVTSSSIDSGRWGGRRKPLQAFTEQGVAMLSSVLRSARAIAAHRLPRRLDARDRSAVEARASVSRA